MKTAPLPAKTLEGQAIPCPVHLIFYWEDSFLVKVTLETSDSFLFSCVGQGRAEDEIADWLSFYFKGKHPPLPSNLRWEVPPFHKKVLDELMKIPIGETASYQEIAKRAGSPQGARAVGQACHHNPFPFIIPCHRVISTDGSLGGFGFGLPMKEALLDFEKKVTEGIAF